MHVIYLHNTEGIYQFMTVLEFSAVPAICEVSS
jgi:hypothetical protein